MYVEQKPCNSQHTIASNLSRVSTGFVSMCGMLECTKTKYTCVFIVKITAKSCDKSLVFSATAHIQYLFNFELISYCHTFRKLWLWQVFVILPHLVTWYKKAEVRPDVVPHSCMKRKKNCCKFKNSMSQMMNSKPASAT